MVGGRLGAIALGSSAALLLGMLAGATPALATPQVTEFRVPGPGGASTGIAVGTDRAVWFTEFTDDSVGRLKGGAFSIFPLPTSGLPDSIVAGPDGALWTSDAANSLSRNPDA